MAEERKQQSGEESPAKRRLEAIAAAIGAVLALGTLAIIVWDGVRGGDRPAIVTVEATRVTEHSGGFVVELLASNSGDATAVSVVVEGELSRGGEAVETSETTFDYVPRRGRRQGGLFFSEDPRLFDVSVRALGYVDP